MRCGYNHGSWHCPAMGKMCCVCKGVGHFGVMCCSTPIDAQVQPVDIEAAYDDIVYAVGPLVVSDEVEEETRPVEQSFHIGTVDGEGAAWITEVLTNRSPI